MRADWSSRVAASTARPQPRTAAVLRRRRPFSDEIRLHAAAAAATGTASMTLREPLRSSTGRIKAVTASAQPGLSFPHRRKKQQIHPIKRAVAYIL